jgi:GH18 family chitinase
MKRVISYLLYILLLSNVGFSQSDFKVIGYAQSNDLLNISKAEWSRITHLNVSFINAEDNGDIATGGYMGKGQFGLSDVDIKGLVKKAHANDVKVLVSLAGGGFWGDEIMRKRYKKLMSAAHRASYIQKLTTFLSENNLDGIDIDIEGDAICRELGPFICDMSVECKKNNWELTAAWGGRSAWADSVPEEAVQCLDYINIMSYDATGSWDPKNPGQHASYEKAEDDIKYWHEDRGVAYDRLVLGLPFYGKRFSGAIPGAPVIYSDIVLDKKNAEVDQTGQTWYNGRPTIQKKTKLSIDLKLGGVMIWEILGDADGDISLLGAIQKTLINENTYSTISGFKLKEKILTSTGDISLTEIQSIRIFNMEGTLIKFLPTKKLKIKEDAIVVKANLPEEYHILLTINGEKRLLVN